MSYQVIIYGYQVRVGARKGATFNVNTTRQTWIYRKLKAWNIIDSTVVVEGSATDGYRVSEVSLVVSNKIVWAKIRQHSRELRVSQL
jgi:hypothetical protein